MPSLGARRNAHELVKFLYMNVTALPLRYDKYQKMVYHNLNFEEAKYDDKETEKRKFLYLTPLMRSWKTAGPGW